MSHYTDNLCANFEEAPGRAHKRIWYVCLTMSLHWFRLWLGAAYTTHYCLNKWWHKPTMYVCVIGLRMLTHGGQDKMAAIFLTTQIAKFMGPTWVMSAPCWPHEPCYQGTFSNFLEWKCVISLKSVFEGPINNIPASVQIMAWCLPGDKQLSEPMMVRLPTHMRVTRPQSINVETHKLMRSSPLGRFTWWNKKLSIELKVNKTK